ncbi:MAG: nucleoside hydrolase, partial [Planctomycetota bacterium]
MISLSTCNLFVGSLRSSVFDHHPVVFRQVRCCRDSRLPHSRFFVPRYFIMQRFQLRLVLLLICGLNFDATALTAGDPIPVIFDTDITGDVDDVLALAMLHALADRGECNIEAITISKIHPQVVAFVDAVNTFYGRPDLAIGMTRDSQHRFSKYLDLVSARSGTELRYPHDLASNDQVPDAVTVLRRTLANAEDRSVVVIQVGLATNLADLLDSSADDICPLSGPELIRQKVRLVSIMAGAFSPVKGNDRYLEANVR